MLTQLAKTYPYLALTVLCAVLFLPGLSALPPTDRDEARFMQATKQMIETGDYVSIRFQGEPRNKKPVGIHWLQAAAVKAISPQDLTQVWPYRLPSVLGAWLAVLLTFFLGRKLFDPDTGLIAAAMLATCLIVAIEAHLAKTDAALLATVSAAMGSLALLYAVPRQTTFVTAFVFWVALAGSVLLKGPVLLAVVVVTILSLWIADRRIGWLKSLRPLWGVPLLFLLVLPWLLALANTGQSNFVSAAFFDDLWPKLIGGQESHGAPPGTHLFALLFTAWPWSAIAPLALVLAWRGRHEPAIRFCLAWLVPCWLLMEAVPTKLPHYTLPLFPALMLLMAQAVKDGGHLRDLMYSGWGLVALTLWGMATLALAAVLSMAVTEYGDGDWLALGLTIIALALTAIGTVGFVDKQGSISIVAIGAAAALFVTTVFTGLLPRLDAFAISPRLAAAVAPHAGAHPVALVGYYEPSAVFLLGTNTRMTTAAGAGEYLAQTPGALAALRDEDFSAAEAAAGKPLTRLARIPGYNYSRGEAVTLNLVTITLPPP